MAGGMGGFFGHFSERFNDYGPFNPAGPCGYHPESLKVAFRTYRDFWEDGRLKLDMYVDNSLTDGYCMKTPANDSYVFYKESTSSVQMDLSGMSGSQPAIAVDTKLSYAEIDLGTRSATNQTWTAPYSSDWVIQVGN